jgi:hypothetical protein
MTRRMNKAEIRDLKNGYIPVSAFSSNILSVKLLESQKTGSKSR